MRVLGFSGKAMHGKDTCASIFQEIAKDLGHPMGSWAMAHPLKANVFGEAGGKYTFSEVWFNKPPAVRKLLQRRGTEEGRDKFGPNLWTLQCQAYLKLFSLNFPVDGMVFTDIRFPNEVEFVRSAGLSLEVYGSNLFMELMIAKGYEQYMDTDPEDPEVFAKLLEAEQDAVLQVVHARQEALANPFGMALYISSDRPTLTGEAALHLSETALDDMNKSVEFDGVINNNVDVTLDDLRDQLTPYAKALFQ